MLKLIKEGKRNTEIAAELGLTVWQIKSSINRLKDAGRITESMRRRETSVEQRREKVYDLVCEDLTASEIAKQLGVEYGTIHNDIKVLEKRGWLVV